MGYPDEQLHTLLGSRIAAFEQWMNGQTIAICDGRLYNHARGEYEPSACAEHPHGTVVYEADVEAFLRGRGPLD